MLSAISSSLFSPLAVAFFPARRRRSAGSAHGMGRVREAESQC